MKTYLYLLLQASFSGFMSPNLGGEADKAKVAKKRKAGSFT